MKKAFSCILLTVSLVACTPHAAPNVSPEGLRLLASDKYTVALSDFQDGLTVAYHAEWLSKSLVHDTAVALEVAFKAIKNSPAGAKAIALGVIDDLRAKYINSVEFVRYKPYLDSVYRLVEAL